MIESWFDGVYKHGVHKIGYGFCIYENELNICQKGEIYKGKKDEELSQNVAEHYALNRLLIHLLDKELNKRNIRVFGDNQMCIYQMQGYYGIKKGLYVQLARKNLELSKKFTNIEFKWIRGVDNREADKLSRKHF